MTTNALASEDLTAGRDELVRLAAKHGRNEQADALIELLGETIGQAELTERILGVKPGTDLGSFRTTLLEGSYTPLVRAARRYARSLT